MLSRMQFMCFLVVDNVVYVLSYALPLYQIQSNRIIGSGVIAFKKFGGYSKCRHECSCSSARRVSNCNTNVPLEDIYPPMNSYRIVFGIDNVMPF